MYHNDFKKSGVIHKIVGQKVREKLHDGISALEIVEFIEENIKELSKYDPENPLKAGIGFPVGISINDIAAHDTPCKGNNPIISGDDVVKIDYGVHINGCISDGAFSWCPSGKYNELIRIAEEATMTGVKNAGPDARIGDIGGLIQEVIESGEVEIGNKMVPIKSIYDLYGHSIEPYKIHGDKVVPNVKTNYRARMEEDEVFAIETFPTTGSGKVFNDISIHNHFMIKNKNKHFDSNTKKIYDQRSTLAFCPRWFDFDVPESKYIEKYPAIRTFDKGIVAQYEKTIYVTDKGVDVIN